MAPPGPVASRTCGAGSESDGGVTSVTTTWNVPVASFCCQSRAEHDTVVAPIGNWAPDTGLHETAAVPETVSSADVA